MWYLTDDEKKKVEDLVNEWIAQGLDVKCEEMKKDDAIKSGAECMFIEKYPDIVTVYSIGNDKETVSKELCGGPHVKNTSELGHFKIKKEEKLYTISWLCSSYRNYCYCCIWVCIDTYNIMAHINYTEE